MSERSPENKLRRVILMEDCKSEGFEYVINHYDSYRWVNDMEFQARLEAYNNSREQLAEYIGVDPDQC